MKVKVYPEDYSCTRIKITDSNGMYIPNARIYCESLPEKLDAMSDSSGCYDFVYPEGSFNIYIYQNGYLPQMITISSEDRKSNEYVSLKKQNVVTGNISVKELDFNEIKSLGIDINDPENQNVYEYSIDIKYDVNYDIYKREVIYIINAGNIVGRGSYGNINSDYS